MSWNAGYAQLSYAAGFPSGPIPSRVMTYSRSGSVTGRGRSNTASMSRKAEVQAPMARARERIAAAEVTLRLVIWRQPKIRSARSESSQGRRRRSRLDSRWRSGEPKARRASSGSRPWAMASAMCACSSSSISPLTRPGRNALAMPDQSDILIGPPHRERIDADSAEYGRQRGQQCRREDGDRRESEHARVGRLHLVEQRRDVASRTQAEREPGGRAYRDHRENLRSYAAGDVGGARSDRDPNPDLPSLLRHRIIQHAVQAHASEQQRNHAEESSQ